MNPTFFHFVLSLPDHVNYEIIKLKNEAKRVIGDYRGMASKPHITINNYPKQTAYIHENGFSMFERRLSLLPAIVFEIDGFDYIDENNGYNKTIYARLKLADHNKYWLKLLWDIVGKSSDTPHITIARSITPEQFNILWPHFQKRELNIKFVSSRFTILKNQARAGSQMYREFEFKGSAESLTNVYQDYLLRSKKATPVLANKQACFKNWYEF